MDSKKDSAYYIEKIVTDIDFCISHLKDVELEEFCCDDVLLSAISFKFVQISENVKKLPLSIQSLHPNIPWTKISGLRNRIVHDYGSVQLDIIYYTVKNNLPELFDSLNNIKVRND